MLRPSLCGLSSLQASQAAEPATPRIFQCVLPDGRKVTSDRPIAECMNAGKPQRELNQDGSEKAIVEAPLTEDEKAERDRIRRQREAERTAYEIEVRRDRDMLKRFPNEAAHGKAREKALDDVAAAVRNSEARIKLLLQERKPLLDEAEFYSASPCRPSSSSPSMPTMPSLEAQRSLVQNQQTEVVRINALYDTELARLKKLWAGRGAGTSSRGQRPGDRRRPAGRHRRRNSRLAAPPRLVGPEAQPPSFAPQQRVDLRRIGLALAGLHRLADQGVEGLVLAGAEFLDRLRIGGDHVVDDPLERAGVAHLLQALRLDDRVDVAAFAVPEGVEHLARGVVGDGAVGDAPDQRGQLRRRQPGLDARAPPRSGAARSRPSSSWRPAWAGRSRRARALEVGGERLALGEIARRRTPARP